ncbi:sigma-B regulation protein RsbQ [Pedobacter sp. CAN_A7]|uniref:alpha/beta fold hydrolase n=1 Tax=Pedobacter sp. CAN_A7 TaxID=2787722 RepID=UPI0018CB25B4
MDKGNQIIKRNNVRVIGQGRQTIMFAHGFGNDQNSFNAIVPAFENDYKIVLFDYVGSGQSDLAAYDEQRYKTLSGFAMDIVEISHALDLRDVIFIGHSVSSMIGVLAAEQEPALFQKLIFIGPSPRYINEEGYHGGIDLNDLEDLMAVMDSNYLGWSSTMAPAIVGNPDRPELGQGVTASFQAADPTIARNFAKVTFYSDYREKLPFLKVPSLTIQGQDDVITSVRVAQYVHQHTPDNQMAILNSSGHCPHLSDPDAVISAIKNFI